MTSRLRRALAFSIFVPAVLAAQRGGANSPFPGGENPDGSLKPSARLQRLFSQDAYTEYALLEPGSEQFRIRYLTEETRAGSTELVNATRGGSEGTDVEVYDPRTGKPLPFTYEIQGETHAIHAKLTAPVPPGGIGRVLIYKTYKDPRTYQVYQRGQPAVRHPGGRHLLGAKPRRLPARRHSAEGICVSVIERRRANEHARPTDASSCTSPTRAG